MLHPLHPWNLSPTEAVALQRTLRDRVRIEPLPANVRFVAGADISAERFSDDVFAGWVVIDATTRAVVERAVVRTRARFPYVPGLLSFREGEPLLEAFAKLSVDPDVLVFDGHGIAHPRRFGIAAHLGVVLDKPSVGCGKTVLVGTFDPPAPARGSWSPMVHRDEVVGAALRTKDRVSPVFVSPGHRADLASATALLLSVATHRVPEPTRQAHLAVNEARRAAKATGGRGDA